MSRTIHRSSFNPASSRNIAPLPHPSWIHGSRPAGDSAGAEALTAQQFWERLGI
jgi:hypothetical protein